MRRRRAPTPFQIVRRYKAGRAATLFLILCLVPRSFVQAKNLNYQRRTRRRRNPRKFCRRLRAPAQQLQLEALFTASHRPVVIRSEDWLQEKRKLFDDWFVRANRPVVSYTDKRSILLKSPNNLSLKMARRVHREAVRIARFHGAKIYAQRVREPTAGAHTDQLADTVVAFARFEFFHLEIN